MPKKLRPNRRTARTVPQTSGSALVAERWLTAFYAWSGLPYESTEETWLLLLGLGIFVVGICYLQQVTWEAKTSFLLYDTQQQLTRAQSEYQTLAVQAAQASSLQSLDTTGYIPVDNVVFADH